jgi:hypothetical protein
MSLTPITGVLNACLDELVRIFLEVIHQSCLNTRNLKNPIQACGHDTAELDQAIDTASKALFELETARDMAVSRFKSERICVVVDKAKRKEIKLSKLQ